MNHRSIRFWITLLFAGILPSSGGATGVGYLFIQSDPPGAKVIIDSCIAHPLETPALCTLAVGEHTVTMHKMYYEPKTTTVNITLNRVLRKMVNFVQSDRIATGTTEAMTVYQVYGELTILTDIPGGIVYIDGEKVPTPVPVTLSGIPAGEHRISIELDGLVFDTNIVVPHENTRILQVTMADVVSVAALHEDDETVNANLTIELPGCKYERDDGRPWGGSNMKIKGVDSYIQIAAGDTTHVLSHVQLAQAGVLHDYRGYIAEKKTRDTILTYRLTSSPAGEFRFGVRLYVNQGPSFKNRDNIESIDKDYVVPADLNAGEPIEIRMKIEADGVVVFRYW